MARAEKWVRACPRAVRTACSAAPFAWWSPRAEVSRIVLPERAAATSFLKATHADGAHCDLYVTWAQHWSNGDPWGRHWEGYAGPKTCPLGASGEACTATFCTHSGARCHTVGICRPSGRVPHRFDRGAHRRDRGGYCAARANGQVQRQQYHFL